MIKHFYLLYYNFIKWQERTKRLNNDSKTDVAEYYVMIIIALWLIFIYFVLAKIFNFDLYDLEKIGKFKFVMIVMLPVVIIRFLMIKIFTRTFINFEDEFNQIKNWKNSRYRKQALAFTIFYFIFFIPLTVILCA